MAMTHLTGKVAVITGATSGIGRACAERFSREGARVVIAGRREHVGRVLAERIGNNAFFVRTDVMQEADIRRLMETSLQHFGRIDCVISNAGATSETTSITGSQSDQFERDLAVHVRAPFLAM